MYENIIENLSHTNKGSDCITIIKKERSISKMNHFLAIIIKLLMITAVVTFINSFIYGGLITNSLLISLILTFVTYIVGDLWIFTKSSKQQEYVWRNTIATFSDAILVFIIIYFAGSTLNDQNNVDLLSSAFASALVLGIVEWLFHKYMDVVVFKNQLKRITEREPNGHI